MGIHWCGSNREDKINRICIKDTFNVFKLHAYLLLVEKFIANSVNAQFNVDECIVKFSDSEAIMIAPRKRILYKRNFMKVCKADAANLVQSLRGDDTHELWHHRLCHLNVKGIHKFQNMVSGMNVCRFFGPTTSLLCKAYIEGK